MRLLALSLSKGWKIPIEQRQYTIIKNLPIDTFYNSIGIGNNIMSKFQVDVFIFFVLFIMNSKVIIARNKLVTTIKSISKI
jgi:hypothetical protein